MDAYSRLVIGWSIEVISARNSGAVATTRA